MISVLRKPTQAYPQATDPARDLAQSTMVVSDHRSTAYRDPNQLAIVARRRHNVTIGKQGNAKGKRNLKYPV